jgi:hypothetical protein
MSYKLQIVNPLEFPAWDEKILAFEGSSFFHSSSWARVLVESYRFRPFYCAAFEGEEIVAALPFMEVRDIFGRKKGVCSPFSDFCQPLYKDENAFKKIFEFATEIARKNRWRSLAIRGNAPFPKDEAAFSIFFRHVINLKHDENKLLKTFRKNTQRNIRKARRGNVTVSFEKTPEALREFYRLNCLTRKRHGLPPQPMHFFTILFQCIILQDRGIIALARIGDNVISASVFFHFGNRAYFKYGASNDRFAKLCANYLVMWDVIRYYRDKEYATLCLGRTESQHKGLRHFKTGWGAEESIVNTCIFDVKSNIFIKIPLKTTGFYNHIFANTPLFLLKIFGDMFYKFMG